MDEDIFLNYQSQTDLELPFEGEWFISNGGRSHAEGRHHFVTWGIGQRYAMDVVIMKGGKSHTGDGTKNEEYYCFGLPLYAPAAGVVVAMEDGIEDNVPGVTGKNGTAAGNYVIIDHQNDEYSLIAHFQKGTVQVSVGDTVTKGQELGNTGNSGNSSEPHLHYHLQNSPTFGKGMGLPASFLNYYANDVLVESGEPSLGQTVRR